ncbi:GNAT family N-acetyltransferase [Aeromicrobium sp. CTD01-1L150]|uniref:GNAT family N-acetyltransferase n=1 Tax=Aeromicrobium sp. CTD01-1L150 TaxID=3341830 RepID=UPI0035C14D13
MQVVRAVPGDEELLASLEQDATEAALAHVFGGPYPLDAVCRRWRDELLEDTVVVHLACDPEPVGYLAHDTTTLLHLGVVAHRRGTGLADDLMALLPADVAQLWVLDANARARRFYERRGWLLDGRVQPCEFTPFPLELGYSRQDARS